MMKKESYRHILPHFQQPGQAYFITWNLKDTVPAKALNRYTQKLENLKSQIADWNHPGKMDSAPPVKKCELEFASPGVKKLKMEYYSLRKKYIKAYDDLLDAERNPTVDLSKPGNTKIIINALKYWAGKKLTNHAYCIMPNHVHWVVELFEKDEMGDPVYLQDILYSVKRFSSTQINKVENRKGALWQKESFETTIRDEQHLYYAVEYTLNNPVKVGWVDHWKDWAGCWSSDLGAADSNPL
jgi:putative transposase